MTRTNPNGANQYQLDPRQKKCWEYYTTPTSATFSNALQSALKAGYTEGSANKISAEKWFVDRVRRMNLMGKAEKVLEETLEYDAKNGGERLDPGITRVKLDAAKHVTSTRGKEEGYEPSVVMVMPAEIMGKNNEE